MVFKLRPSLRSQAGSKLSKKYKGKPEAKPVKMQISILRVKICLYQGRRGLSVMWGSKSDANKSSMCHKNIQKTTKEPSVELDLHCNP